MIELGVCAGSRPARGLQTKAESAYEHTHIVVRDYPVIYTVSANPRCSVQACILLAALTLMHLYGAHGSVCCAHLWNVLVCPVERNCIETGAQVSPSEYSRMIPAGRRQRIPIKPYIYSKAVHPKEKKVHSKMLIFHVIW